MSSSERALYARVGDKNILLKECPYSNEDLLREVFYNILDLVGNSLGREFVFCGKEVYLSVEEASLSADMVLIDEEGVPTIIETKLVRNRESRRDVLGQILEYITAIYLNPDQLKEKCFEYQGDWSKVRENIEKRKIRGIIVSDTIPSIVKYTIEMINEQLSDVELYGLELRTYCSEEEGINVMVPQIIGVTSEAVSRGKTKKGKVWTYDELVDYINSLPDAKLRERLIKILEWANENKVLDTGSRSPTLKPLIRLVSSRTRRHVFRIGVDQGTIEVVLGKDHNPFEDNAKRIELFNELHERGLLPENTTSPDEIKASRVLTKKIGKLTDQEFEEIFEILKKYIIG